MKKQYEKPQTAALAMLLPQSILASSDDGPDIIDQGKGGDGSDIRSKQNAFSDFDDEEEGQDNTLAQAISRHPYSVWK